MSNKDIKIITFGNFPYGGASANFIRYLSLALAIDNTVEVIIPNGYFYGKTKNKNRKGKLEDVNYKYLGLINRPVNYLGKIFDSLLSYFLLFFFLIKTIKKPKVIILYNIFFTNVIPIILSKIVSKNKYIVILPEFYEKPTTNLGRIKWYNFYFGISSLINFFDGAIVLSHYLEKLVISTTNNMVETMIIPNLLDPNFFSVDKNITFKKGFITIGYCGTPTRKDGAKDLIKSFALLINKHQNVHLLIIGDITNGNSIIPELKELARSLNVLENITFTGLVPFSKIPHLLTSCQILALTRPNGVFAQAGFPTKLGEYFACRRPVVITNVGDIPKYFTNEKHVILVNADDINSIAKGFEKLLSSSELQVNIAKDAYQWMDVNLNYRNVSKRINHFIDSLVNDK